METNVQTVVMTAAELEYLMQGVVVPRGFQRRQDSLPALMAMPREADLAFAFIDRQAKAAAVREAFRRRMGGK